MKKIKEITKCRVISVLFCTISMITVIKGNWIGAMLPMVPAFVFAIRVYSLLKKEKSAEDNEIREAEMPELKKESAPIKSMAVSDPAPRQSERYELFFEKCRINGISAVESDADKNNALLIARSLGICADEQELLSKLCAYFDEKEKERHRKQKLEEKRKREEANQQYRTEKKLAHISGKYKYLLLHAEKAEAYYRQLSKYEKGRDAAMQEWKHTPAEKQHKPVDPYIVGGLAQGIAGPAAGIFAALSTRYYNEKQAEAGAAMSLSEIRQTKVMISETLVLDTMKYIRALEAAMEPVRNAMNDDSDPEGKFARISFEGLVMDSVEPCKMVLRVGTVIREQYRIVNTPARIDGSVRIVVVENDEPVGEAYYSAYGFGDPNLCCAGFGEADYTRHCENLTACAVPYEGKRFSEDTEYTFRIEPVHIWAVEALENNYWSMVQDAEYQSVHRRTWGGYIDRNTLVRQLALQLPDAEGGQVMEIPAQVIILPAFSAHEKEIRTEIMRVLRQNGKSMTLSQLKEESVLLEKESYYKLSHQLREICKAGMIEKYDEGRKAYFKLKSE